MLSFAKELQDPQVGVDIACNLSNLYKADELFNWLMWGSTDLALVLMKTVWPEAMKDRVRKCSLSSII